MRVSIAAADGVAVVVEGSTRQSTSVIISASIAAVATHNADLL